MLTNCNALSASRLKMVGPEFKKHTQTLVEMKKDLDYIFKKIRAIKAKLSSQYPTQFAEALRSSLAEECEEDVTGNETSGAVENEEGVVKGEEEKDEGKIADDDGVAPSVADTTATDKSDT